MYLLIILILYALSSHNFEEIWPLKYLKHCMVLLHMRDLFEERDKIYNLRSTVSLKQPKCNTVTYCLNLNSFRYNGAKICNDLPNKIKNSITFAEFKNQIKKWQGPKCLCNMCTRLL